MSFDLPLDPLIRILLAALRAGTVFALLPVAGGDGVPGPLRVLFSFLLGAVMAGMPAGELPPTNAGLVLAAGRELLIGLAIGFLCRVLLAAPAIAGDLLAEEIGLKMAEDVDPLTRLPASAPARLFETSLMLLFLVVGGHHDVVRALHQSFTTLPVGVLELPNRLGDLIGALSSCLRFAVMIAAPLMAVLMVGSLALALLSRAVPELQVPTFGYPLRLIASLVAAVALFPFVRGPGLALFATLRRSLLVLVGA